MTEEIEDELELAKEILFKAIQKAKKEYSKELFEKGLDEAYYPVRIIVYEAFEDGGYTMGKKEIEIDDRQRDWGAEKK